MGKPEVSKLLVIGGAPRAGKDTSFAAFLAAHPDVPGLSIDDHVRLPLWQSKNLELQARADEQEGRDTLARRLFQERFDGARYKTDEDWFTHVLHRTLPDGRPYFLERHDRQHEAVWQLADVPSQVRQLAAASRTGSLLVQGVVMRPHLVRELEADDLEVRAIYLGNENPDFTEKMLEIVHEAKVTDPTSNWMALREWSDDRVKAYMEYQRVLSARRRVEAGAVGFPYVDMGEGGITPENFDRQVSRVVGYLATEELVAL